MDSHTCQHLPAFLPSAKCRVPTFNTWLAHVLFSLTLHIYFPFSFFLFACTIGTRDCYHPLNVVISHSHSYSIVLSPTCFFSFYYLLLRPAWNQFSTKACLLVDSVLNRQSTALFMSNTVTVVSLAQGV